MPRVPRYMVRRYVRFMDALPKNVRQRDAKNSYAPTDTTRRGPSGRRNHALRSDR